MLANRIRSTIRITSLLLPLVFTVAPHAQGIIDSSGAGAAQDSLFSRVRWLVPEHDLSVLREMAPEESAKYFNNDLTSLQGHGSNLVPDGWKSVPQRHYTSFASCKESTKLERCTSLTDDLKAGTVSPATSPLLLYDDEKWPQTPRSEVKDPCGTMERFTKLAHEHGFVTVMAPDQNLGSPVVGVQYQGGESRNWQSYLRLGLGTCAARTGTERYHIMAQAFESKWKSPEHMEVGGEAEFVNYVTQAALQAKSVNPKLLITVGLSGNPRYNPTAEIMYQESVDVRSIADGYWLNLWGNQMGVAYLKMLASKPPAANSSVLFLANGPGLGNSIPVARSASKFSLAKAGSELTSWSRQTYPAGTTIPAGAWEFQFWTDGNSGTAQLALEFGYCNAMDCTARTPIIASGADWVPAVAAGALGAADARGAFTTRQATTLPDSGSYALYWTLKVVKPGTFNLLYGAAAAATNLATPFVQPIR